MTDVLRSPLLEVAPEAEQVVCAWQSFQLPNEEVTFCLLVDMHIKAQKCRRSIK